MPNTTDMKWFKENFHTSIEASIAGTPFTLDLLVAIACQETGHIWSVLRNKPIPLHDILALCVGDTLDAPNRGAFPKTKGELLAKPRGEEMFRVVRKALEEMAKHVPGFPVSNPDKFCHGFGIFQYDLQFFLEDPDYFLEKRYEKFTDALAKCLKELTEKAKKIGLFNNPSLDDRELTAVAIAYNTGTFKPALGLKQGHFNGSRFYGEEIFNFIRMSRTVPVPAGAPGLVQPPAGNAAVAPPTPVVESTGPFFEVDTQLTPLLVRSEAKISSPSTANVIAHLPDGHPVRSVTGTPVGKFLEIETSLNGAHIRGFASLMFVKPAPTAVEVPVVVPDATPPVTGIVAVFMPRKSASVTKRTAIAGAHSLNEPNRPERKGATPAELCVEIAAIIKYLACDKGSHTRYQPRSGLTFCNIYAHDYCHLAGVYLPRVWWTPGAIEQLARGKEVEPLIGNTIDEHRANDLFRWLRDFGPRLGWRQTGTVTKLQQEVNQGAIGLIVARRKEDGKSGHIVLVVPETETDRAKRDSTGEVTHPLQSQVGRVNFRYGTSTLNWWKEDQFAESAFWLHG